MHTTYHLLHLPHHKSNYLSLLYVVATIRTFVLHFLSLFIPILLFKNLSIFYNNKDTYLLIGLAYLMLTATHGLSSPLVSFFINRFGIKLPFIIAQVLLITFLGLFNYISQSYYLLLFFIWGFAASFWWVSYHYYFLEVGQRKKFGEELGKLEIIGIAVNLIAPIAAGLMITYYGSQYLFITALLITASSFILLLKMKNFEKTRTITMQDVYGEIKNKHRDFLGFIGAGGEEIVYTMAWPLLLFTVLKNYLQIGIFSSMIIIIAVLTVWFVGKLCDTASKGKLEKIGSFVISTTWIGKTLIQYPMAIFVLDSVYRVFYQVFYLPLTAMAYNHAVNDEKIKYVVFREVGFRLGNVICIILYFALILLGLPFWFIFIFAALFSLMPMLIKD